MCFGRKRTNVKMVEGLEVVELLKYLGVEIVNKRRITSKYIQEKVVKSKKMVHWLKYLTRGKLLKKTVGKSIWKGAMLLSLMHGMNGMKESLRTPENDPGRIPQWRNGLKHAKRKGPRMQAGVAEPHTNEDSEVEEAGGGKQREGRDLDLSLIHI